jgi:hypothetical protein
MGKANLVVIAVAKVIERDRLKLTTGLTAQFLEHKAFQQLTQQHPIGVQRGRIQP